ncbi:hypothetical protein BC939DRAFT_475319 [Gamsiella multidivaricata]|uniref:uncharacterized protein n=1 Tax=Gamsiella multidivaricata TaxID=101098 RepID=UPI00221EBBE9|nr:uncharacterized protein BC939DRAFT_475319 [Gamsiella multidivaricata]KAG0359316.1 hypothetical protein BGZ54_009994 [Gamsiella multidivaricata]KAI7827432.1 hypothetical protein BC939DRAFT_475319 [Gamsiella multidivaricata]
MSYVKVGCLLAGAYGSYVGAMPPKPSRSVPSQKEDKVIEENGPYKIDTIRVPMAVIAVTTTQTALYLYLITYGPRLAAAANPPMDRHLLSAILQLQELKPWHLVAAGTSIFGAVLRKWSFIALDRFFTFHLSIRSGHRLIGTGPYTFLRHPSYSGGIMCGAGAYLLLLHQGLWDVSVAYLGQSKWFPFDLNNSPSFLGIPGGILITGILTGLMTRALVERVKNEEIMLSKHFGKEWDVYASKRWRFIPFIY